MVDLALADRDAAAAIDPIRIGAVTLAVRDMVRVERFYREVIGLHERARSADSVSLGSASKTFLTLVHRPDALPDDVTAAGLYHTAFLLPTRGDLADWVNHAAERRVRLDGASDHEVSEAIYLSDPEGNGVEVYADRPRASWRWESGEVRMTTARLDMSGLMAARSGAGWRGAPAGTRVGHVHLRVGNVAQAARFWMESVGLDLARGRGGAAFLSSGGYHHHIAANVWESSGAGPRDPRRAGLLAVTLETDAPARDTLADPWGTEIRFLQRPGATEGLRDNGATGRIGERR